ncbi:hypothetical protein EMIHUDRAFT_232041 [Emiliania huxleyi CCMP1516]|uniref:Uncharacterized protein n=2 Tax=Emiliania huxleyi TaxID=2903 RepID=A0A0D3K6P2_EMIH1|nr:hypothetical protein EMIHUDRAFT_232041 [Emiliania huxleyi CCMP1516]EOD31427.1 hypothetical protein EMIHUDRAFT_232041 [Emiliania huxleyi CCMP1516]|eukprot:XP_005783856.1 hypothetical protein EMIHUDRAFT_232041 [Emiliania huxleyi CCMP1516]
MVRFDKDGALQGLKMASLERGTAVRVTADDHPRYGETGTVTRCDARGVMVRFDKDGALQGLKMASLEVATVDSTLARWSKRQPKERSCAAGDPVTVTKPGAARSGQSGTVVETTAQGALVRFEDSEVEAFNRVLRARASLARWSKRQPKERSCAAGDPVTVTKPGAARSGQSGTVVETTAQGALVRFEDSEVEAFNRVLRARASLARWSKRQPKERSCAAGDPVTVTKPGAARSGQSGTVVETTAQGALVRFEDSEVEAFKDYEDFVRAKGICFDPYNIKRCCHCSEAFTDVNSCSIQARDYSTSDEAAA